MPVNFWFEYPIHRIDDKGYLGSMPAQGTTAAGKMKNSKSKSSEESEEEFRNAYDSCNISGEVTVHDMAAFMGVTDKTIYYRIGKMNGEFCLQKKKIIRVKDALTN